MLRMPDGRFEQTSSSAYPNVLIVDYIKKARVAHPGADESRAVSQRRLSTLAHLRAARRRLRLVGQREPLVWLSATASSEFNDMAKVYPIDRGSSTARKKWLMHRRAEDGTWSTSGPPTAIPSRAWAIPNCCLPATSSGRCWTAATENSGIEKQVPSSTLKGVKDAVRTRYILALGRQRPGFVGFQGRQHLRGGPQKTLRKLESKKQVHEVVEGDQLPGGRFHSLSYARGDSLTVQTTALAVLAMQKSGQFTNVV